MKRILLAAVAAGSLLFGLGLAGPASAQEPLTINTAGLSCTQEFSGSANGGFCRRM